MEIINPYKQSESKKVIPRLQLEPTKMQGLKMGTRKDGSTYSVRDDRSSYFYPSQWLDFINVVNKDRQMIFKTLIGTGARIDEALNIKPDHYDFERNTLTLYVTKIKARKGERVGKKRTFSISSDYSKEMKKYIEKNSISDSIVFPITQQGVYQLFKRSLKNTAIKDPWQFSLHNIRKTHGNWLKALGVPAEEICLRLGHDFDTYLRHYGSPNVFSQQDKITMTKILGDIYGFR
jgi:integrase